MSSDGQAFSGGHSIRLRKELIDWLTRSVTRLLRIEAVVGAVLLLFNIATLRLSNFSLAL